MASAIDFSKFLFLFAKRANYRLDEFEIELYVSTLEVHGWDSVCSAMKKLYVEAKNQRMPTIKEIEEEIIGKAIDPKIVATDIANRMYAAVAKYGYTGAAEARNYVGEVGWFAFGGTNGYVSTCQSLEEDQKGFVISQWRDACLALLAKQERGLDLNEKLEEKTLNETRIEKTLAKPKMNALDLVGELCRKS